MARSWNHRRCSSHSSVAGVGRVCVLAGQDPEAILEFAREIAAASVGRSIPKPGPARSAPSGEVLRHAVCVAHVDGSVWGLGRLCIARGSSAGPVLEFAREIALAREALELELARRRAGVGSWPVFPPAELGAPLAEWAGE